MIRWACVLIYLLIRVAGSLSPGKRATIVHMGQLFIVLAVALVAAAVVFGVTVLIMGGDQGLDPAEPDGRAVPLPGSRPLTESDLGGLRFDVAVRGYRMAQVDQALRRAAYDVGYKEELIGVLEAEVDALRAGRVDEADTLRAAREVAARPGLAAEPTAESPTRDDFRGGPVPAGSTQAGPTPGDPTDGYAAPTAPAPTGAAPGDAEPGDAEPGDAAPGGTASAGAASTDVASGAGSERAASDSAPMTATGGPASADRGAAIDDAVAGDADDEDGDWPAGFGKMDDPAAAEPAK